MWAYSDTTEVDMYYVIHLILDLTNFGVPQLPDLASLCTEISRTFPDFGITLVDILLERIRRCIERDSYIYRQRQLIEVRFLAELINAKLVPFDVGINTATQILSLNMKNPKDFLIAISGKKRPVITKKGDFFKVKMVCELLSALFPTLQKVCVDKYNKSVYNPNEDSNFKDSKYVKLYSPLIILLQLFVLIREPIPPSTSFDLSDLLDKFQAAHIENTVIYESILDEELRNIAHQMEFSTHSIYRLPNCESKSGKSITIIKEPRHKDNQSDSELSDEEEKDEGNFDDDAAFMKSFNELKEDIRLDTAQHNAKKPKIIIPISLMASQPTELAPEEKMTKNGPPSDFNLAISDGGKPLVLSFALSPAESNES